MKDWIQPAVYGGNSEVSLCQVLTSNSNFNQQYFTFKPLALFAVAIIAKFVGSKSCNGDCNGLFHSIVNLLLYGTMGTHTIVP